jgi:hypothetical protein
MTNLTPESLLTELESVIRAMPPQGSMHHYDPENLEWLGRATAVFDLWAKSTNNSSAALRWHGAMNEMHVTSRTFGSDPSMRVVMLLHQAQSNLRLSTIGPLSVAIGEGKPFQYFDELRKIIAEASNDVFFIDPYLNADFVSSYLHAVKEGVNVRLLGAKYMSELKAASAKFAQESKQIIEAREGKGLHDRWVIIDKSRGFFSGASFKDGGVKAQTILAENVDAFGAMQAHYEKLWADAA